MWRNIIVQSIFQLIASFVLLFAGASLFGVEKDSTLHYTLVFNSFVWLQIFNEVNARKLKNQKNMFAGISTNYTFVAVMVSTIVVQVLFVQVGGRFTSCEPLSATQWLICVAIGAIGLPLGVLMRFIPVPRLPGSPLDTAGTRANYEVESQDEDLRKNGDNSSAVLL